MTSTSLRQRIERTLADGPGTAMDVALELERDSRRIGAYLRDLWRRGHLARQPYYLPCRMPGAACARRVVWMYVRKD